METKGFAVSGSDPRTRNVRNSSTSWETSAFASRSTSVRRALSTVTTRAVSPMSVVSMIQATIRQRADTRDPCGALAASDSVVIVIVIVIAVVVPVVVALPTARGAAPGVAVGGAAGRHHGARPGPTPRGGGGGPLRGAGSGRRIRGCGRRRLRRRGGRAAGRPRCRRSRRCRRGRGGRRRRGGDRRADVAGGHDRWAGSRGEGLRGDGETDRHRDQRDEHEESTEQLHPAQCATRS